LAGPAWRGSQEGCGRCARWFPPCRFLDPIQDKLKVCFAFERAQAGEGRARHPMENGGARVNKSECQKGSIYALQPCGTGNGGD
jgi:hypothetical protein